MSPNTNTGMHLGKSTGKNQEIVTLAKCGKKKKDDNDVLVSYDLITNSNSCIA